MAKPTSSRCLIEIQLDNPERAYKPGERIKGSVEILPGTDMKCRRVTLTARWSARGKGPEDAADYETITFPGGAWRNNEKVSHPFDFPAPQAPLSYKGELFDIRWYLTANADLPATKDASAVVKFQLMHGQANDSGMSFSIADAYNPFAALGSPASKQSTSGYRPPAIYTALNWTTGLMTLAVLAAIVLYFIGLDALGQLHDVEGAVTWSVMILGAAYITGAILRKKWRARRREALNQANMRAAEPNHSPPRPPAKYWVKKPPHESQRGWPRSITSLALFTVGMFLMAVGIIVVLKAWGPDAGPYILAALAGLVMVTIAKRGVRPSLRFIKTAMTLGRVDVTLSPERLRCGDDLHLYLDFRSSIPGKLVEATATLEAYEVVEDYFKGMPALDVDTLQARFAALSNQSKKFRFARVTNILSLPITLSSGRTLLPQESANLSGKFAVPAEAPPTFLAVGNKILWFMAVRLKLASGIQWSADIPIYLQA
jgi:hypothetical protein